ncbi:MAG: alpha/beta hydrolase [Betaproteobacteria bacterium HGW-Betaproteobacteria-16]|nr:MAG: alpha/beta hydrolase [Betaproteobacteria bacterium HGW-Betaproteobacteria-16]
MSIPTTLPRAPMDPALAGFLAQAAAQGNPPMESLPPEIGRQIYRDLAAGLGLPPPAVATEDRHIPGPGGPLKLRIYHPDVAGALPALFYVHGGGYVIGDLETHDAVCRTLCHDVGAVVVAVDYRLAPEHPFPAAVDDVICVLRWLATHAPAMRVDPSRIAVAGDSAGAQLATVACLRTAGAIMPPRALGLIYPVAQHHTEPSASMAENGEGKFLTLGVMQWFINSYLGDRDELKRHPDFALLSAGSLASLPPTWVATMGHDPLRDEGHALAQRIEQSGVATEHRHYPGAIHACIHFTAVSPVGAEVVADLAGWLRGRLS